MQGIQFSANSSLTERLTLGNKLAIMQITVKVFVLNVTWEHGCGDVTVTPTASVHDTVKAPRADHETRGVEKIG